MPYPRYNGGMNTNTGAGNYGSRGYNSSGSGVSPWQSGQPGNSNNVDPLTIMGSLMGAMMGGGAQQQSSPLQQLAGLAMANAINTGAGGGMGDRGGSRGYDRDRDRRQVGHLGFI